MPKNPSATQAMMDNSMQVIACIGNRDAVDDAVRRILADNPLWWVADTKDWGRVRQLVAPPENLLLRINSKEQLRLETADAPGVVVAAVPVGPITPEAWQSHLAKVGARIIKV